MSGLLTRDPEVRTTAGGKAVAQFAVATHEYVAG
jgi:single-stranded DNA-binding protein